MKVRDGIGFVVASGVVAWMATMVACGKSDEAGGTGVKNPSGARETAIQHESCDGTGESDDANNDGKPDIRRIMKGGREVCRVSDVDFDGKPDLYTYFDASGQVRRRETDFDGNGIVNSIEHYEGGKLTVAELDTTSDGKLDTWDVFDPGTGKRVRRERDLNGDGRIDQWWTWEGDKITILVDKNDDGQPDPDSAVVWGPNGLVPAAAAATMSASAAPGPSAAPPADAAAPAPTSVPTAPTTPADDAGAPKDGGAEAGGPRRTKR